MKQLYTNCLRWNAHFAHALQYVMQGSMFAPHLTAVRTQVHRKKKQVRYWSLLYQHPLSFRKTKTLLSLPFRKTGQAEKHLVQESQLIEITSVEHVKGMPVSVLASSGKAPKKRALPFRCRGANQLPFCFQIICPHSVMAIL